MNTLIYLIAFVAVGWLTNEMFTRWSEPILGWVGIGLFAWLMPMTWVAIQDDREIFQRGE